MSKLDIDQIRRMCNPVTGVRAEILLALAKAKTGPGSGYDLGKGSSGLAAICAYLASEELGNGDVTEKQAQSSACLDPKVFHKTLNSVRTVLGADKNNAGRRSRQLFYDRLVQEFNFRREEFMISCMEDAEKALIQNRELRGRLAPPNDVVTLAVFLWTCNVLRIHRAQMDTYHEDHDISSGDLKQVRQVLDASCASVAREIKLKVNALRSERTGAPPTATKEPSKGSAPSSPNKSALQRTPSKSALRAASLLSSPTKTPTTKRKVAFHTEGEDDNMVDAPLETPTKKKAKLVGSYNTINTHERALPAIDFTKVGKSPKSGAASSSRVTLDLLQRARQSDTSDTEMANVETDGETPMLVEMERSAPSIPSTPRHPKRSTLFPATPGEFDMTPSRRQRRRAAEIEDEDEVEDEEPVLPRRHRPALLGHRQWLQRDPRLEREQKMAEVTRRSMLEKYGHPFEHLRLAAAVS
ncbi:unnamed protein product [Somion occarium]|uniref:Uncharacterized protein n=1 Tax=Somion occarium TaxID=3059160 RepID=A0ABP1E339_9APHY